MALSALTSHSENHAEAQQEKEAQQAEKAPAPKRRVTRRAKADE